jgi:diacylglycerol kinase family enzyme
LLHRLICARHCRGGLADEPFLILGEMNGYFRVICILNSSAGTHSPKITPDQISQMFAQRDFRMEVWHAQSGTELASLSQRAVRERHSLVVAGGGDGTINCIAGATIGTAAVLGVLPMGTLNHFAKDLNIPPRIEDAVETIVKGRAQSIDVGEVNGRIFVNNSSLGLYPRLVRVREKLQGTGQSKWVAFVRAASYVIFRQSHLHVRLNAGSSLQAVCRTPFVFVGNNEYVMQGWEIGTRRRLDRGRLWLYMAPNIRIFGLIMLAVQTFFGGLKTDAVNAFEIRECSIACRKKRLNVATDGEVTTMHTPLKYRILPNALRVMVPTPGQSFGDDR